MLKSAPKLSLVEWADTYRYLSKEASAEPGRWRTSRVEVARGPMVAATDPSVEKITILACTQLMKALAVDTLIPTTNGFKKMKDIAVGDKLFDEKGKQCGVLGKSEIKKNKTVKVSFSDGTEVVCDLGHRWTVNDYSNRSPVEKTLTAEEMMAQVKMHQNRNRYSVLNAAPVKYDKTDLPLHPYILGTWLADGHRYSANVCMNNPDCEHILMRFRDAGYGVKIKLRETNKIEGKVTKDGSTIYPCLRGMGLISTSASKKDRAIPRCYLQSSEGDRWALLQGIMDGDGTQKNGQCSITMKHESFAKDVSELICSLGMKAVPKKTRVLYEGEYRTYFVVNFMAYSDQRVFSLPRKQISRKEKCRRQETNQRRITSIEPAEDQLVQCLAVDSPSKLFLCTEAYIPTHNTELLLNLAGYFIHQDPSPILMVQPTVDMAETWSKDRLDPMLRDSPALKGAINDKKRESGNKILHKQFPGGHITMVGANAPGNLAMRPVRVVLFDETDKYPESAGKEGDPVKLASERSATFWNRLLVLACSPTIEGLSRIEQSYEESDQRVFMNPCPHCKTKQEMQWEKVKWPDGEPDLAKYHCVECDKAWTERERLRSIQQGEYKATKEFKGHAGFRCSKLVSPWEPMSKLAAKYEESKGKPEQMKTFINTQLARTYKEDADVPDWKRLYERREDYRIGVIPQEAIFVTAGVDVQKDRLELEIVAWGANKVSWSIDYRVIPGAPWEESTWDEFEKFANETFPIEGQKGRRGIDKIAVDSGYATQDVYYFTSKYPRSKVMCIKGTDNYEAVIAAPAPVDINRLGKVIRRGAQVRRVGSSYLKGELYGWLKKDAPIEGEVDPYGFCHFPMYGDDYFKMLTAEELQTKIVNGYPKRLWVKSRDRNEALDCRCYARAMASVCGIDRMTEERIKMVRQKTIVEKADSAVKSVMKKVKKKKIKRRESSYL